MVVLGWQCLVTTVIGWLLADTAWHPSFYSLSYITGVVPRLSGSSKRLQESWSGHTWYNPWASWSSILPAYWLYCCQQWCGDGWYQALCTAVQSCSQTQRHYQSRCSAACPNRQPGHYIGTQQPSNYVVRACHGLLPTWRMDPWRWGSNSFGLHLMEMVPPCWCSSRGMVHHLCPSNIVLPRAAQAICPIGRPSNARCNQLRLHACLATNRNCKWHSIACPTRNAQGNCACPPAVVHGPQVGGTSTQCLSKLAVAGSRTWSSSPHTRYTSPSYLSQSASSTSLGNQPVQRWSMRGQS